MSMFPLGRGVGLGQCYIVLYPVHMTQVSSARS